jgi:nucleoside-diphosphate-sugar epimerase
VRILVIGGTQFVGRGIVEEAVRRGHEVTVFHRGATEPDDLPEVEHVHGDRRTDLASLGRGSWDAAVDTHAYVPGDVRTAADALSGAVSRYVLVSTIAVHRGDVPVPANEESPRHPPRFSDDPAFTAETYGPLKVACEQEAASLFAGRCLTIRPGYLIGPHDPTDRFTAYVRRATAGGEMVAPPPPDAPFRVLDARDLGVFVVDRLEAGDVDVYGVVGEQRTMRAALETARDVAAAGTTLTWVSERALAPFEDDVGRWLPLWHPDEPLAHTVDDSKAVAAGLRRRPLSETVADILAWDAARGTPPLRCGLPPDREREILEARTASA